MVSCVDVLASALAGLNIAVDHVGLGRYQCFYRLARGGMATVYLAQLQGSAGFKKWVAIKVIHPHVQDDQRFVAMFMDEARLVARMEHPNICRVSDFGEIDQRYFLAMEYLHGETLSHVIHEDTEQRIPWPIAVRIAIDVAHGLHYAHELRGDDQLSLEVVHRDVSPQNIVVLYEGTSKIVDFGIARWRQRMSDATGDANIKGKLSYMAPEQVQGQVLSRRVDVFALGVVLWEATTGKRLFRTENEASTIASILAGARNPSSVVRDYPKALESVVMKSLAHDPADRYATTDAFASALERVLSESGKIVQTADVRLFMKEHCVQRFQWRERVLQSDPLLPDHHSVASTPIKAQWKLPETTNNANEVVTVPTQSTSAILPREREEISSHTMTDAVAVEPVRFSAHTQESLITKQRTRWGGAILAVLGVSGLVVWSTQKSIDRSPSQSTAQHVQQTVQQTDASLPTSEPDSQVVTALATTDVVSVPVQPVASPQPSAERGPQVSRVHSARSPRNRASPPEHREQEPRQNSVPPQPRPAAPVGDPDFAPYHPPSGRQP